MKRFLIAAETVVGRQWIGVFNAVPKFTRYPFSAESFASAEEARNSPLMEIVKRNFLGFEFEVVERPDPEPERHPECNGMCPCCCGED